MSCGERFDGKRGKKKTTPFSRWETAAQSKTAAGVCSELGPGPGTRSLSVLPLGGQRPLWSWLVEQGLSLHHFQQSSSGGRQGPPRSGADSVTWSKTGTSSRPRFQQMGDICPVVKTKTCPRSGRELGRLETRELLSRPRPYHPGPGSAAVRYWGELHPSPPGHHHPVSQPEAGATHLIFRPRIHGR